MWAYPVAECVIQCGACSYIALDVMSKDEEVSLGLVVEEELDGVIEFDVGRCFNGMIY